MQNHNAQKSIMLHLNDMKRKLLACFLSTKSVVQYFICWEDQLSFFILLSYFLLHINVIYLGYFSKMKEIMKVNTQIILVNKFYDEIYDYGKLSVFFIT